MKKISVLCLALVTGLCGCGSGTANSPGASSAHDTTTGSDGVPNTAVHKQGSGSVSALIGPPGGLLELVEGPRVEIPPGAVEGGTEFMLRVAEKTSAFSNKEGEKAVGPVFIFSPELNAPEGRNITVSIPLATYPQGWGDVAFAYEISQGEVVGGEDSIRTKWQYDNAKLSGGRAVAQVQALTGLRMQFVLTNLQTQ
jgi:hypothetical protein